MTSPLTKLRALAEKATPGPVEVIRHDNDAGYISWTVEAELTNHTEEVIVGRYSEAANMKHARIDAQYDAALRNAAPAMMDALEAAERMRNEAEQARTCAMEDHAQYPALEKSEKRFDAAMERVREVVG